MNQTRGRTLRFQPSEIILRRPGPGLPSNCQCRLALYQDLERLLAFGLAAGLRVWASALAAARRPAGLVTLRASARPAALAAFFLVRAGRPVWESALPAAVLAALVALGFRSVRDAAVAARFRVCETFFLREAFFFTAMI